MNQQPTDQTALNSADHIWHNANLVTLSSAGPYGVINNAAIAVKDGRISYIGELAKDELPAEVAHTDMNQRWITPGLIDCHTHIVFGGNRANEFEQRLTGVSYEEIARQGGGILSTVRATRAASHDQLLNSSMKRVQSLLDEGVTTLEIKSGYGLSTESELKMLQVADTIAQTVPANIHKTFLGAHALPPEFAGRADDYIDHICQEMLPAVAESGLASCVDAFCENIGFNYGQVKKLFQHAEKAGLNVKLHAEQLSDQRGAELAAEFGALSADHLEFVTEAGVKALAAGSTAAVLLPGAFYYLRETQLPPIDLFRQHDVPMVLATDANPGSSPGTSLLLMLNMACTLFRMTPEEALRGITINAAKALGIADTHGSLEVGKVADFAFWDIESPAELSYAFGQNPCVGVVKNGVTVMERAR
ncbi:imidazolonepropionase [Pleionea sp. CnH1-48]|uniref:imidazolonepropionase n=1 Tax=Pleionea sp. CnH1-48 TaxID=2954494 RepID=UPI0020979709|nr:imidazolonepropionase [Pleionea sp. CnH1-48]MCO7227203.1 imidazolonepropionase [Pleionea sp. CnH1-48]